MKRNVVNHQNVENFISQLSQECPLHSTYINSTIKNYLVRQAPVELNLLFRFKKNKTEGEKKAVANGGPYHNVILGEEIKRKCLHIFDYFDSEGYSNENVPFMSFDDAYEGHEKWVRALAKKKQTQKDSEDGVTTTVQSFDDGMNIVKLEDQKAYSREGALMRHCVGSYYGRECSIYSLRTAENKPVVTIQVSNNLIQQISEFANARVGDEHKSYLNDFAQKNNLKFNISYATGGTGPVTQIIVPAMSTFMAFQWKHMLTWFDLGPTMKEMPSSMSTVIGLALGIHAFWKWFEFFANFGNNMTYSNKVVDKL